VTERAPVSVVIPCYRCAATVARTVESVLEQSLPPAEILLVEDSSGDSGETLAALEALRQQHGEVIKVLAAEQNGGVSRARNLGWDTATQPYVAFLDADDAWHPEKLRIQYQWMTAHPDVDICGHQIRVITTPDEMGAAAEPVSATRIARRSWLYSCRFSTISVMLRRELPFRFEPGKHHAEDYLLWLRIALNGHDAWRIETPLAYCFKPLYGSGGLTQNLWQVEKGELDTYRRIYREGLISYAAYCGLAGYSLVKYLRRVALAAVRGALGGKA
jgi:glycosyltransferase involved in cell wall biosynthesis